MILERTITKCTSVTEKGTVCPMKQNCKRYLSFMIDKYEEGYVSVMSAPDVIDTEPLNCPLKIIAHTDEV